MVIGIVVGILIAVSLVVAFMVGYGMADLKHKSNEEEE